MNQTTPDFDDAFHRCFPRAFVVAMKIVDDAATAEDVAADAMIRAYTRWRRVSAYDNVEAWVVRVASNLAIDALRRRQRRVTVVESARRDTVGDGVTARVAVAAALQQLPRRQREAVVLCHLEGFTPDEVGAVLHMSPNTVRTHVRRGIEALRTSLADKELPSWTT